jgi:helix-turn-helix protein
MSKDAEVTIQLQDLESATQAAKQEVRTDDIQAKLAHVEETRSVSHNTLQLIVGI